MGVKSVLKTDPVRLARNLLDSKDEVWRIERARARRLMLEDNSESVIKRTINKTFTDATVRSRVNSFASLARSQGLFKRVVTELARPIYVAPPVRSVTPDEDQGRYDKIARDSRLDCVMDNCLTLAIAQNTSFLHVRYGGDRLNRLIIEVLPSDVVRVIPDPDDPQSMLGLLYSYQVMLRDGSAVLWHAYCDDEMKFVLDHNHNLASAPQANEIGRIPVVAIHTAPRYSGFWNTTSGDDLVEGENSCAMLMLLAMRKLKARGFRALILKGDMVNFPKGQVWDEESGIQVPEGMDVQELGQEADAANYLEMIEAVTKTVAANHGISRARLNQDGVGASSDVGLMEQRSGLLKVMRAAESDLFDVVKLVSRAFGDDRTLSEQAQMSVDFGEITQRVDPKTDLDVWETRRKRGTANILDQIKAENPDIRTDAEAWSELERNLVYESEYVKRIRALNMSPDATVHSPGKTPEENGADGGRMRGRADDDWVQETHEGQEVE